MSGIVQTYITDPPRMSCVQEEFLLFPFVCCLTVLDFVLHLVHFGLYRTIAERCLSADTAVSSA